MFGVFQNIDPPPPHRRECVPPPLMLGEDALSGWRGGWGVNSLEDARHCSVLYYMQVLCGFLHHVCERLYDSWYFLA